MFLAPKTFAQRPATSCLERSLFLFLAFQPASKVWLSRRFRLTYADKVCPSPSHTRKIHHTTHSHLAARMLKTVFLGLLGLVLVPLYLACVVLYGTLWFIATVTGIGPLLQMLASRGDRQLLETTVKPAGANAVLEYVVRTYELQLHRDGGLSDGPLAPEGDHPQEYPAVTAVSPPASTTTTSQDPNQASSTHTPSLTRRRLAVRWSPGQGDPSLPPVCIPNGLGATIFTIATLHDSLEAKGYPVLSYDRAGVGLSDPLPTGEAYSADGLIKDLKAVMDYCVPPSSNRQWLLVGPSMGSIVCQVFIAKHPGYVLGFLNMDGLPFPFAAKRGKFEAAGKVYCVTSCLTYTGVLRPLLALASGPLAALTSKHFTVEIIKAQMNQPNFYESIAREMTLMLDLCDLGVKAWGPAFDLGKLNAAEREVLIRAPPTACGDALDATQGAGKWIDLPRAPVERGSDWASATEVRTVLRRLLARAAQQQQQQQEAVQAGTERREEEAVPLWLTFQSLIVRVMSARCYNFGLASSFYDGEMQSLAAMEHALHASLAGEGGQRLVFPTRSHDKMFFGLTGLIATQVDEITRVNAERKGLPMPKLLVEDDGPATSTPAEDMV